MAQAIRHASAVKPRSIPVKATVTPDDWDRVQSFSPSINQPLEKLYELGRLDKMATYKDTLESSLSITQYEYGTIDSFLQLAGQSAEPGAGLSLSDFDDTRTDFYLPGKDEYAGSLEQTLWLQKMVVDSIGISMNAEERIERSFELSGDYAKLLREGNKYLIFKSDTVASGAGGGSYEIDLSDPAPVVDPNNAGVYILQLYRIRSGTATEMTSGYSYDNGTNKLTITSATDGDNYRIWYSSASYGTSGDPTSLNDADDYYIKADNVTVTIDDGTNSAVELTKLTTLSIDATFNRIEQAVIGDDEKILRDVESYDVNVSLDGYVKNSTIEEALMTQAGQSYGIIDFSSTNTVSIVVKIYETSAKSTFLIGYKVTDLEFTDETRNFNANEFADKPLTLNSDNLLITTTEGNL
ncbi:MAG: hypothetical protein ACTSWG_10425 [Candidatus Helarchaeota archaeon]